MKLKVVFSIDPTGFAQDITELVTIPVGTCLLSCCTKTSILTELIKSKLEAKGYNTRYYFEIMKVWETNELFEIPTFSFPKVKTRKELNAFGYKIAMQIEDITSRIDTVTKFRKASLNAQMELNAELEIILGIRRNLELSNKEFNLMVDSLISNLKNELEIAKAWQETFNKYSKSLLLIE